MKLIERELFIDAPPERVYELLTDAELVDAIVALFLPHMPEIGRQAGIVGPEVAVAADAPAQDRLLGAMGRHP